MTFTWPIDRSRFPALPEVTDPLSEAYIRAASEQIAAAQLAVTIMHALSGRQFGLYRHTVRPCRQGHRGVVSGVTSYLLSWEGDRWVNWPCGCVGGCERSGPRLVHLPGPVHAIVEVTIAGAVQDESSYTVEDNVLYHKITPWPFQDLGRPLGEPNTWAVTYERGIAVPAGVAELTGLLATEILAALNNEGRCRLPRTVTTASRQGVTYRAYDPGEIYANGKTGIPEIDLWLSAVNPRALAAPPSVL